MLGQQVQLLLRLMVAVQTIRSFDDTEDEWARVLSDMFQFVLECSLFHVLNLTQDLCRNHPLGVYTNLLSGFHVHRQNPVDLAPVFQDLFIIHINIAHVRILQTGMFLRRKVCESVTSDQCLVLKE